MAYLAALAALMACSDPQPFESQPAELTRARAQARFALPIDHGDAIVLVVDRVVNPGMVPIVLIAEANGQPATVRRLTLYPPDRPARFALRLSPGSTHIVVALQTKGQGEDRSTPKVRVKLERSPAEPNG